MNKILAVFVIIFLFSSCSKPERRTFQDFDMYYWRSSLEDLEISPNIFEAKPYIFETIPLSEFSFDIRDIVIRKNMTSETILIILGWSRDGKILLMLRDVHNESYKVIDLVNSPRLNFDIENVPGIDLENSNLSSFNNDNDVGGNILYNSIFKFPLVNLSTKPSIARDIIFDIAKQYNIEPFTGEIGIFPFNDIDNNVYNILLSSPIKVDNYYVALGTYIYKEINPDRRKFITYLGGLYSLSDWYINNTIFLYAKSPFENRIAVIGITPHGNVELEPIPYQVSLNGINLNNEF